MKAHGHDVKRGLWAIKLATLAALSLLVVGLVVFLLALRDEPVLPDPQSKLTPVRSQCATWLRPYALPLGLDVSAEQSVPHAHPTNTFGRILADGLDLAPEQVEPYVQRHNRSAESLLAAYRTSRNRAYLREAMEKYPDDPRVCLDAYCLLTHWEREDSSPEQILAWLEALKKAAPENALGNYLAAAEYFKAGKPDLALQELCSAAAKPGFTDYLKDYAYFAEEAYRAAGCSEVEAKVAAVTQLLLPHMGPLKQLAQYLTELAGEFARAGDESSAHSILQMAVALGQRLDQPGAFSLMHHRIGNSIQWMALSALEPNSPFGSSGQTVQDQLDTLAIRRQRLPSNNDLVGLLQTIPDDDLVAYFERVKLSGEENAVRWLQNLYGPSLGTRP